MQISFAPLDFLGSSSTVVYRDPSVVSSSEMGCCRTCCECLGRIPYGSLVATLITGILCSCCLHFYGKLHTTTRRRKTAGQFDRMGLFMSMGHRLKAYRNINRGGHCSDFLFSNSHNYYNQIFLHTYFELELNLWKRYHK